MAAPGRFSLPHWRSSATGLAAATSTAPGTEAHQVQGMPATGAAQSDDTDIHIFHADSIVFVGIQEKRRALDFPARGDSTTSQQTRGITSSCPDLIIASRTIDRGSW